MHQGVIVILVLFKRPNKMRCVLGGTTVPFVFNELNKLAPAQLILSPPLPKNEVEDRL